MPMPTPLPFPTVPRAPTSRPNQPSASADPGVLMRIARAALALAMAMVRAVAAIIGALFRLGKRVTVGVARGGIQAAGGILSGVAHVADGAGRLVEHALEFPVAVLRGVIGSKAAPPTAQQAAATAASANEAGKVAADATVREASVAADLRSAVRRLARGRDLPDDLADRLDASVLAYLGRMREDEWAILAATPPALLAAHLAGQRATDGVRSMAEIAALPPPPAPRPMMSDAARKRVPADGPYVGPEGNRREMVAA